METEKFKNIYEYAQNKNIVTSPPTVELFLDPSRAAEAWPKEVATNKEFLEQIESRKELNDRQNIVLSNLPRPDISLEEAISKNCLSEKQVTELYKSLSDLIDDNDYKRIILYLPFEFLPNETWTPSSKELQQSAERFKTSYMAAWDKLLITQDVRANFVDGDIPESEYISDNVPRVVKAAHLIPKLIEKNFLDIEKVFDLMESCRDEILKHTIADTLPVLSDLKLLQEKDIERIKSSSNAYIRSKAEIIASADMADKQEPLEKKDITLSSIQKQLDENFHHIDTEEYGDITTKRKTWLMQEKKRKAIELAGNNIKAAIVNDGLNNEKVAQFIAPNANLESQLALIDGIRKAIESVERADAQKAKMLYAKYRETLISLWKKETPEIHNALSKTFCHLLGLGIMSDEQLKNFDITIPALTGPFSKNLDAMKEETDDIRNIIKSIESDAEISKYIYPVVLISGSRLKGYGDKDSDIDVGIFVKPGTPAGDMEKLRTSLKTFFSHEKIHGEIAEFWLEENEDELRVLNAENFDEPKTSICESYSHLLFGSAWEGNQETINELRKKLLVPYLYDKEKKIHGYDARRLQVEELERDTLQYRLMHKGYEKFFPSYGGIDAPHADQIDGKSVFWDSGYRQMATKLYASNVFLPKIHKL